MTIRTIEFIEAELLKPLGQDKVKSRKQAGQKLSYLSTDTVKREANRIFGPLGWESRTVSMNKVYDVSYTKKGYNEGDPQVTVYEVGYESSVNVLVWVGGVTRVESTGYGFGNGTWKEGQSPQLGYEMAIKEAESDALKRALNRFGDPLGLALYDKEQTNVVENVEKHESLKDAVATAPDQDTLKRLWTSMSAAEKKLHAKGITSRTEVLKAAS